MSSSARLGTMRVVWMCSGFWRRRRHFFDGHTDLSVHDGGPDQERTRYRDAVGHPAGADARLERRVGADLGLRTCERDEELDRHRRNAGGKLWAMPQYLLGIPFVWNKAMFKKAGLNPNKGPKTWTEFLADAKKLKAAGFTPFGMGNKDGYGGAWFFSLIGKQSFNSIDELKAAMVGKTKFPDLKFLAFYQALADLKKNGYLNSDVASISFTQGLQLFGQKKVAMSWITDGNVTAAAKVLGGTKGMGVSAIPVWGKGKLATSYDTTQSSSAFITSWSKHPKAAAQFLTFLHRPQALKAWYAATGVFPADKRFPASLVTDPIAKQQLALNQSAVAYWPENFVPPQVDGNADLAAGQLITSGSGSPADAVNLWKRELAKWKAQHPDEFKNYTKWASGG